MAKKSEPPEDPGSPASAKVHYEASADVRTLAVMVRAMYQAFLDVGFDEDQAWTMTVMLMDAGEGEE